MTFQDGRHSILSLVLSFITLFSFQGAIIIILFRTRSDAQRCMSIHASISDTVINKIGGLKWTRTIDLPLIRRTL